MVFSQELRALRDRYPDLPWPITPAAPGAPPGRGRPAGPRRRAGRLRWLTLRLRALA